MVELLDIRGSGTEDTDFQQMPFNKAQLFHLGGNLNPLLRTMAYLGMDSYYGYDIAAGRMQHRQEVPPGVTGEIAGGSPRGGLKKAGYVLIVQFEEEGDDKFKLLQKLDNPGRKKIFSFYFSYLPRVGGTKSSRPFNHRFQNSWNMKRSIFPFF